ncbi:BlaI/MecI/CopY family transcriptional regulator [Qiania dongpingensis]|uniref:BlaI/MecI/CopY family transcriptional regulator n=1 Tax=Qiania dongpingensis TaxID=2763669 RepID=A0A7G9G560_9FIRM|nr:BlaI/MecI/CopY family transcriptional regulator [Qiania dongpingensis]QNM05942.1 BlaI/MecI/CopY family transcriptional regulator [Qiania dongpingensis]
MNFNELSDAELIIMKIIWDAGRPVQAPEVTRAAAERYGREWARTTVSTYLKILVQKGYLEMTRTGGKTYIYTPLIEEGVYQKQVMNKFSNFWGKGFLKNFVTSLHDEALTDEDIQELKDFLNGVDDSK